MDNISYEMTNPLYILSYQLIQRFYSFMPSIYNIMPVVAPVSFVVTTGVVSRFLVQTVKIV